MGCQVCTHLVHCVRAGGCEQEAFNSELAAGIDQVLNVHAARRRRIHRRRAAGPPPLPLLPGWLPNNPPSGDSLLLLLLPLQALRTVCRHRRRAGLAALRQPRQHALLACRPGRH